MGPTILQPGQRLIVPGVRVFQPSMATLTQWWLSGGISAANCIAAYQPKGAADLASSYINLANPGTFNAAAGVAPTFAIGTGWTFNGSSTYLTTGVVPGATSWSVLCRFANVSGTGRPLFGCFQTAGTKRFFAYPKNTATDAFYGNGNGLSVTGGALSSGVVGWAGLQPYASGVATSSAISAGGSVPTNALIIGGESNGGTPSEFINCDILAFAIYSTTLNSTQVGLLTTAMNNL